MDFPTRFASSYVQNRLPTNISYEIWLLLGNRQSNIEQNEGYELVCRSGSKGGTHQMISDCSVGK